MEPKELSMQMKQEASMCRCSNIFGGGDCGHYTWQAFHLVVHLLGAVEDVHHDAQRSAQVLGGLGFPRACRTSWGSAHGQVERLSQCDVASVTDTHTQAYEHNIHCAKDISMI